MRNPPIILIVLPLVALFCLGLATTTDYPGCLAVKPGVFPINTEARAALVGCWIANQFEIEAPPKNTIRLVHIEKDADVWIVRYLGAFEPKIEPIFGPWPVYPLIEFEITESSFATANWMMEPYPVPIK